jgi:predicted ester cyclase
MKKQTVTLLAATLLFTSCKQAGEKQETSTTGVDYTKLVRENGTAFHKNFSAGAFDKNGLLVTEDIYVNSNNTIFAGRDNFVTRIKRYDGPFPGLKLSDRIVIVEGNIAAVHYLLQGEQKGKYGDLEPTGNKVEAMSAEFFTMDENGLMKDLLTITQLDKLKAQIKGEETITHHQDATLYPIDQNIPKELTSKISDLYLRYFNFRNWDALEDLLADDVIVNWNGKTTVGVTALMAAIKNRTTSFSNLSYQLDRSVAEGNRAAIGYTMHGKHDGTYTYKGTTYQPTQKEFEIREAQYIEVGTDGTIKSVIAVSNQDEFLKYINPDK